MFQNQSLGPSTSSKTPKLTAPHMGFVFGSLINRGSLLFFFLLLFKSDWQGDHADLQSKNSLRQIL